MWSHTGALSLYLIVNHYRCFKICSDADAIIKPLVLHAATLLIFTTYFLPGKLLKTIVATVMEEMEAEKGEAIMI